MNISAHSLFTSGLFTSIIVQQVQVRFPDLGKLRDSFFSEKEEQTEKLVICDSYGDRLFSATVI